jgi:hypothetical protein
MINGIVFETRRGGEVCPLAGRAAREPDFGRAAVERWGQKTSEDGLYLFISVTYAPPRHGQLGISETYKFPALAVAALEAKNAS